MADNPLATVFGTVGVVYGLLVPLILITLFAFFLTASQLSTDAKPRAVAKAMYCYVLMGIGLLLMTIAAIPTVASVLAGESYSNATYLGLLILFAGGGIVFLQQDKMARRIDSASRLIPSLIYLYTVKLIGTVAVLLSGLSIILTLVLGTAEAGWWIMPITIFLYGFILAWSTHTPQPAGPKLAFPAIMRPIMPSISKAIVPKKTVKKASKKKRSKKRRK